MHEQSYPELSNYVTWKANSEVVIVVSDVYILKTTDLRT